LTRQAKLALTDDGGHPSGIVDAGPGLDAVAVAEIHEREVLRASRPGGEGGGRNRRSETSYGRGRREEIRP